MHLKKIFFFCNQNFMKKKIILSYLKMNLKISHKQRYLFVKGFKRLKINFWQKVTVELVKSPFRYLFKLGQVGWSDQGRRVLQRVGEQNCLKYLKRGWKRKERKRNKDFNKGGKLGQGVGALKGRGLEPHYKLCYCINLTVFLRKMYCFIVFEYFKIFIKIMKMPTDQLT